MGLICRVTLRPSGLTLTGSVRNSVTWEEHRVQPLLLHSERGPQRPRTLWRVWECLGVPPGDLED